MKIQHITPKFALASCAAAIMAFSLAACQKPAEPAKPADAAKTAEAPKADAGKEVVIGLITKTETNPFFIKMKEGAEEEAKKFGLIDEVVTERTPTAADADKK